MTINSCSSDKNGIRQIVEEWQGKHVELPEDMTDFLTSDAIDLKDADFTILTYVDSAGCTLCKMKLPLWKEFLSSLDSVCDSDVRFLMVVHPSDPHELRYAIKSSDFNYPVFLDIDNKVSQINSFPDNAVLQTLLLDRNHKVKAIGSPLYTAELTKLYEGIISGQMSVSTKSSNVVSVRESRIQLGNLHPGETISKEILFTNRGNDTIRIKKVISSCECSELSILDDHICPDSDLKARLQFKADTVTGEFERTVQVFYTDFDYPTIITISGNIIQ